MRKYLSWGIILLLILLNVILVYAGKDNIGFNNISLMSLISIDVTVVVSVYIVQSLIDKRRRYEYVSKLLSVIAEDLCNESLFDHSNNKTANLRQQYISNRLYYIKSTKIRAIEDDIQYIEEHYKNMQLFFGDHPRAAKDDIQYEREKTNIFSKIAKIQLCLFGFNVNDTGTRNK